MAGNYNEYKHKGRSELLELADCLNDLSDVFRFDMKILFRKKTAYHLSLSYMSDGVITTSWSDYHD